MKRNAIEALVLSSQSGLKCLLGLGFLWSSLVLFPTSILAAELLPHLSTETPIYDFGEVNEGAAIEHDFTLRNTGKGVLEIRKILPACGCTAAVVASEKIAPNDETALKVRFDTTGFRGYKIKTVRVYTNDPEQSSVVFTLKGKVRSAVMFNPPQVNFGAIQRGSSAIREIQMQSIASGVTLESIRPRSEFIKVEKLERNGVISLAIRLSEDVPVGIFRSRVAVRTNSQAAPLINIPVFAKVRGDLTLSSAAVSFGLVEGPKVQASSKSIEVVNQSDKPVLLLSAQSDHPNVSAEVTPVEVGRKYTLKVVLSGTASGAIRAKIKIETDHEDPEQKTIIVPVYAIASRPTS